MKNIHKIATFIFLAASLVACNGFGAITEPDSTEVFETAISMARTEIAKTQKAVPSTTPTHSPTFWATASLMPGENIIATPKPEQQVYIDPEGWYSVNFPSDLEPTDKENRFSKGYSFFETGYLPEMGTMSNIRNVCSWLVNIVEEEPENFIRDCTGTSANCAFLTNPDVFQQFKYEIYENPSADPAHRFAYVKTGWYSCFFRATFSWLKPINGAEYISTLAPLDVEEIAGWEKIAPVLQNVSVTEYDLPSGSDARQNASLSDYVPDEALPIWGKESSNSETEADEKDKVTLSSLGYDVETEMIEISSGQYPRKKLYRDGRLLFDFVFDISDISSFSTNKGPLTAFVVTTRSLDGKQNAFLIQNDAIVEWRDSHQDPPFPPILYQEEPLWLKVKENWNHVQVLKSDQEVIFSFFVNTEPIYSTKYFTIWNDHWVWVTRDFLIMDGEILNEKLGFQEIFNWRLINYKPAYLFRKDGRVGFSYDGKIIPLEYQDVARNWWSNKPYIVDNSAHFFAERDGVWYYVVLKFR